MREREKTRKKKRVGLRGAGTDTTREKRKKKRDQEFEIRFMYTVHMCDSFFFFGCFFLVGTMREVFCFVLMRWIYMYRD